MTISKCTALFFVLLISAMMISAQQPPKQGEDKADTTQKNGGQMMDGQPMMGMGVLMPRAMIAPDGSIIVISGMKMMKYDKDLNLKKEVTVKMDTTAVRQMMKHCPTMHGQQGGQSQPQKK
ncbi:MAG TPA: hypothetical protein PLE24_15475 [Chitinispirillaceae bacterium]|nr:hypothetical protein [Chitinispirillaceae bacterium]